MKKKILLSICGVLILAGIGIIIYALMNPISKTVYKRTDTGEIIVASDATSQCSNNIFIYNEENANELAAYQAINNDVVGIIKIDDTILNHPFMQTPDDEDKYLRLGLDGKYNSHGCPFAAVNSSLEGSGGNLVIFGHNISLHTKDVFADLVNYEDIDFYKSHPYITTVTESGTRTWVIWGMYLIDTSEENTFHYTDYTNFDNSIEWNEWHNNIDKRNWIHTGIDVSYGDTFLSLSTCSKENAGSGTNRMSVVAKLVSSDEDYSKQIESATLTDSPLLPLSVSSKK